MSKEACDVGGLQNQLRATEAHVARLLAVLRDVGRRVADGLCFCGVYLSSVGAHSAACRAARAELEEEPEAGCDGDCSQPGCEGR